MSPPVISPQPTFGMPNPDCPSTQSVKSSEIFNFSAGLSDAAGFNYSKNGAEKSHLSGRSRPRLTKMRKRQMPASQDRKTAKTCSGLNGFSDGSAGKEFDGKLGNVFGGNDGNSGLDGSVKSGDLNGNVEQLGNGLDFGVSLNGSLFDPGSGNGKSLFGSSTNSSTNKSQSKEGGFSYTFNKGSSNSDVQKETGSFVFGAGNAGPTTNQNLPGDGFVFGPNKNGLQMDANLESGQFVFGVDDRGSSWKSNFSVKGSRGNLGQPKVRQFQKSDNIQFVFSSGNYDSASRAKLDQQDSDKSGLHSSAHEFGKYNSANFVFGAGKNASTVTDSDPRKQDCSINVDKSEPDKVSGNTIPDVRGKVKLDNSGYSEKVSNLCFQCPFNGSDSSSKNHVNFLFTSDNGNAKSGIDLENKSTGKNRDMPEVTDSGKENAEMGFQSQNTHINGVFVFGGLKGKGGLSSGGSTKPFNKMNQLNRGESDGCNGFGQHNHNTCSDINSKVRYSGSSGDSLEKGPAFSISEEMKRLNIGDPGVEAKKSGNFTNNFAANTNNMFVFGGDKKNSGFMKENCPGMNQKAPDVSAFSNNNSKSDRPSSLFPSAGIGIELNGGFCEVPSTNKDEKDSISSRRKLAGFDSHVDYSTPNMKFDFSNNNLFPGMNKLDNTNLRSPGGKRSKKRNGKLRQRTVVQQLFCQSHVSKEGNSGHNHESPVCGSPMDFSPYQDTSASNVPKADTDSGVKGEFPTNEKHISEHCEKPHDDKSTSSFFPSLSAQDGLSAVRHQYKKKYKLKVGLNPTVRRNDPDKENAKQEPSGTAIHEVCEHWRIRGNEAYHAGNLSKAEEFYSMGINSVPYVSSVGYSMKPLLLCYSNRAATRMSLGRMREAIGDCTKASELDSDFLKATLRAGNCYLVLGEVEDAIQCYTRCLSARASICLDRRVTIEAADGLQKAKKVAECMNQSAKVLQEGTDDTASSALGNIEEALSISRYSERLLEMKGEALYILRRYDEVIQLCERTLDIAEKNFSADFSENPECKSSHVKLWRWHLQAKSHYRLGRLDLALELIEKQEKMPISSKAEDATQESSIALMANIRELLSLKKSGNEAFNSGRYAEAIENYTAAISKSFESRGFMAICFCNRAAAYQSLSQIVDAISDCSVAIALDENYLKAISRRATLHEMVRDYKQAVYDLQKLVSLLESQSQIKTQGRSSGGSVRDLRKARRRLSAIEEKAKKEIPLDVYLILGIKSSDAESEIKKAYRKAALRHHPDKAGQVLVKSEAGDDGTLWKEFGEKIHKDADRLFKIIGEAYAVLSEPSKRSKYDNEEEIRNIYRDGSRNSNSGHPSTSYSSPFERESWSGRQGGFSTSFERSSSRRHWYDARSY